MLEMITSESARRELLELAEKYDWPGPRYTTYPTASHFRESFGPANYELALAKLKTQGAKDLSLYVHLPFCQPSHPCDPHEHVGQRASKTMRYVEQVKREADLLAHRIAAGRQVVSMHWSGVSASLPPTLLKGLAAHLRRRFAYAPDAEVSIEADPSELTEEHLTAARRGGFNRISFGAQTLAPVTKKAIEPLEALERATELAREEGFAGVSYDLVYGLPHQTPERFQKALDAVIRLVPDRLSVYSYTHAPRSKHQQSVDEDTQSDAQKKPLLFLTAVEELTTTSGYRYLGRTHFVRPDDPLSKAQEAGTLQCNFQGYSTHRSAVALGLGLGAISRTTGAYAQNEQDLRRYYAALGARRLPTYRGYWLSPDDRLRRHVIIRLLCDSALDIRSIEDEFGIRFRDYFADALKALEPLEADGLVNVGPERIEATPEGRLFVRNLVRPFDCHLCAKHVQTVHSRTVWIEP